MPVFNILLLTPLMFFCLYIFWHFYDLQFHSKWAHVIMSSNFIDKNAPVSCGFWPRHAITYRSIFSSDYVACVM